MDTDIHVVINRLDLSDGHNRHAGATIASVLENTSKPVTFHITHDGDKSYKNIDETNSNIAKYQELVSKYHSKIEFYDLQDFKWDKRIPKRVIKKWPSICLSRLHFHEIFPDLDQILLLGTDTIIETDIVNLINRCSKSVSLSAVIDKGALYTASEKIKKKYTRLGFCADRYFNVDVLNYNLKKIRSEDNILGMASQYLNKNKNTHWYEQDVLNYVFRDDTYYLPQRYNLSPAYFNSDKYNNLARNGQIDMNTDVIFHFGGTNKPWMSYECPVCLEYWRYLSITPWADKKTTMELIADGLPKPDDIIDNIDTYIWNYPIRKKIKTLLNFSLPLWVKILNRYL